MEITSSLFFSMRRMNGAIKSFCDRITHAVEQALSKGTVEVKI